MSIIHVKNLNKRFSYFRKKEGLWNTIKALFYRETLYTDAVSDVSFDIAEGEIVGFLGPNGAGKTTTLKILSGILYSTSGEVNVLGYTPHDRKKEFKKQFGIVMGQKSQLNRNTTPMDNFVLFKEFGEIPDDQFKVLLDELVDLLGVNDLMDVQVKRLSLGERMKFELIASLLHNPKVLFLDEPTIGLDVIAQKNIRDFIKKYNKLHKTTIMLTSHYMDDIKELCTRVIVINKGRVVYDGNFASLISTYAKDKVIKVSMNESVRKEALEKYGKIEDYQEYSALIRVPRADVKRIAIQLMSSDLPIEDVLIEEMPIDDVIRVMFEDTHKK